MGFLVVWGIFCSLAYYLWRALPFRELFESVLGWFKDEEGDYIPIEEAAVRWELIFEAVGERLATPLEVEQHAELHSAAEKLAVGRVDLETIEIYQVRVAVRDFSQWLREEQGAESLALQLGDQMQDLEEARLRVLR